MNRRIPILSIIIISGLIIYFSVTNKYSNDNLIVQGDVEISVEEFQKRLNLTPQLANEENKKESLARDLIVEFILSRVWDDSEKGNNQFINKFRDSIFKEAVYESVLENEISDQVIINEEELRDYYNKIRELRTVEFWTFSSSDSAQIYFNNKVNETTYSKISYYNSDEKSLEYGESVPAVENSIWPLGISEISKPIKVDDLYYIFQLIKIDKHPKYGQQPYGYWKESISKKLKRKKENLILNNFLVQILKDKTFRIEKRIYDPLIDILSDYLVVVDSLARYKALSLDNVPIGLEMYLDQPVVLFKNGQSWTTRELMMKLYFSPYPINFKSDKHLRSGFGQLIRKLVLLDAVAEYGINRNYSSDNNVVSQVSMWENHIKAQKFYSDIFNSIQIDSSEIMKEYSLNKKNYKVPETRRIRETTFDSMSVANEYVSSLKNKILYESYPAVKSSIVLVNRYSYGEVGKLTFQLDIGQIRGPIPSGDNRYSVIELMDVLPSEYIPIDTVFSSIEVSIKEKRVNALIKEIVEKNSSTLRIQIYSDKLKLIKSIPGNLLVKKSHFPNRFVVPQTRKFPELTLWYQLLSK